MPGFWTMVWITVAMVAARSLAMALNRLLDAEIDASNPRTAGREIPAGRLSKVEVWVFCLVVAGACWSAPPSTCPWSRAISGRSWWRPSSSIRCTKRWTWLCHLFLGATIGLGPVGAWVAVTGAVTLAAVPAGRRRGLLDRGFDIIYACMDVDFDREHGIHSIPADFGVRAGPVGDPACHAAVGGALAAGVGVVTGMRWVYFLGVAVCAGLLFYENWVVRRCDLSKVGLAFMTMNSMHQRRASSSSPRPPSCC